ncbi:AAA domain-containing protein [Pseudomonas aeruginosa]|nr:AAA domain-containing protein [Pseudomonas aeruginosa]
MAFQRTVSEGPISVLQGPPGTGKTAFVTKLIHYLFENELAGEYPSGGAIACFGRHCGDQGPRAVFSAWYRLERHSPGS